jgi:hypothetical protein
MWAACLICLLPLTKLDNIWKSLWEFFKVDALYTPFPIYRGNLVFMIVNTTLAVALLDLVPISNA